MLLASSLNVAPVAAQEPPIPFPISSAFSRALQNYSGITLVSGWLASSVSSQILRWKVKGRVRVKVHPYSLTDLLAGKLKKLEVKLQGSSYGGVTVKHLELSSGNPIWIRPFKTAKQPAGVASPFLLTISGCVNQDNVSQALASPQVSSALHMIKIDLPGLGKQQLQFLHPQVKLAPNQVSIDSTLVTAGAAEESGVCLHLQGEPYLEGSGIYVKFLQVSSPDISCPEEFSAFSQQLLNPIIDMAKMDRMDHAFRLAKLNIEDQQITFSGNLLLAPRPVKVQLANNAVKQ